MLCLALTALTLVSCTSPQQGADRGGERPTLISNLSSKEYAVGTNLLVNGLMLIDHGNDGFVTGCVDVLESRPPQCPSGLAQELKLGEVDDLSDLFEVTVDEGVAWAGPLDIILSVESDGFRVAGEFETDE